VFTPIVLGSVCLRIFLTESGLEGAREIRRRKDAAVNLLWSVDTRSWIATPLCESRNQSLGPSYRYSSKGLQAPRRVQKAAGVPDPGFSNQGGKNCSGESRLRVAMLLVLRSGSSESPAIGQKCPKLFAAAECLPFAVADTLYKAGHFSTAFRTAPINSDNVAIQGLPFPGSRRLEARYRLDGYGLHTDSGNGKFR